MQIVESKQETTVIKPGDLVVMKSGSPSMVVVTVPTDPSKKLRCIFWDTLSNTEKEVGVLMSAVETLEAHTRRQTRLNFFAATGQQLPEVGPDRSLVMVFDDAKDRDTFLKDFEAFVEEQRKAGKTIPGFH